MPRLSRIVTRTGDDGTTGLAGGERVSKASARIVAMGSVDEVNSFLGVLLTLGLPPDVRTCLLAIQNDLFDLGGELAMPGHQLVKDEAVVRLETTAARWNEHLPPLREFILPGGSAASAWAHVARATARRAERDVVHLAQQPDENVSETARQYLNRLSDLLFILARELNYSSNVSDVFWRKPGVPE